MSYSGIILAPLYQAKPLGYKKREATGERPLIPRHFCAQERPRRAGPAAGPQGTAEPGVRGRTAARHETGGTAGQTPRDGYPIRGGAQARRSELSRICPPGGLLGAGEKLSRAGCATRVLFSLRAFPFLP